MNARNTITDFKMLLGKKFEDPEVQETMQYAPYQLIEMAGGDVGVRVMFKDQETDFSLQAILGILFAKLKETSLRALDLTSVTDMSHPLDAVISVCTARLQTSRVPYGWRDALLSCAARRSPAASQIRSARPSSMLHRLAGSMCCA